MLTRSKLAARYGSEVEAFGSSPIFRSLEEGTANREAYDRFIAGICRTHLSSPQILAFLYAVAPPSIGEQLKENMLEELGLDESGVSHPSLLRGLIEAAGFGPKARRELQSQSQESLRQMCTSPLLFATFKEVGLNVLLEVTCFEWMLSRLAGRMAEFLGRHRRLPDDALQWFKLHSEVDIRHAEEGLDAVVEYLRYYEFDPSDAASILEITFRENPFLKRYFDQSLTTTAHSRAA